MSGHSKWSTIKRHKEAQDKKRGNIFTKMANAITIAVKKGSSGDIDTNFSLRLAVEKAKSVNMPKDNIARAIDRGLGVGENASSFEEIVLEGYAPGGVPVVVEVVTDNRNRTIPELRKIFDKNGGTFAQSGAVMHMFDKVGSVSYVGNVDDELFLELIDEGAEDLDQDDSGGVVYCDTSAVSKIVDLLKEKEYEEVSGGLSYKPKIENLGADEGKVGAFLDMLRENDDVQEVYSNVAA